MAAIVEECVDGFLQHPFFIADDDVWCFEVEQVAQPVVPVDDAAVEVVEVGCGEASAFERHEWAQVWGDDGEYFEDHPFWARVAAGEALGEFQPFGDFLPHLFGAGAGHGLFEFFDDLDEVQGLEQFTDGFGAHTGAEAFAVLFFGFAVFLFGEQLGFFQRGAAGVDDDIIFVINHAFQLAGGHVEHEADA